MLTQEQELILSEYSGLYDIVVPQDNLLRRINALIDFSFVYQELVDKYCSDNGRVAESPIRMFKYLLLKVIYDISNVDVVDRSRYDMSFKYFLGLTPEADVISPSSLCKFRKLHLKDMDLMNLLIKKTVDIAVEKGVIKSRTIIVDATHTASRSNPYSPIEILRLRSKQLRKAVYDADEGVKGTLPKKNEDDDLVHEMDYTKELLDIVSGNICISEVPAVKQRINMLKETLENIEDHYTTSKDEDARVGHKSEDSSFLRTERSPTKWKRSSRKIRNSAMMTKPWQQWSFMTVQTKWNKPHWEMKGIRHISAIITIMLTFLACGNKSRQAEPIIYDDPPEVEELSDSDTASTTVQKEENKHKEKLSLPVNSPSSTSHKSSGYDNMRGFDPASEDDMEDNGMSRYMENNDEEGWD